MTRHSLDLKSVATGPRGRKGKTLRILLVNSPTYGAHLKSAPLGLLYIISNCRREGREFDLIDGGLVAADAKLPTRCVGPLTAAIGLVHGLLNGLILRAGPGGPAILGIMGALFVIVSLVCAVVVSLERGWTRIVVRVMGSWVAACGILMIAWYFSGQSG